MAITPDTKDWTWVLQRVCPECGFDVRSFPREEVGAMIRANAAQWRKVLSDPTARSRPLASVWSALEYGCHVRDVFRLYDERVQMMLEQDGPAYPNWDQDETAVRERYGEQDPPQVATELEEAAGRLADRFDALQEEQWARPGERSDGARFTVESLARYLMHDPAHHLHDVARGSAALR
ncbi:MAG: DinB family protein [Actinomycetota bacterium]